MSPEVEVPVVADDPEPAFRATIVRMATAKESVWRFRDLLAERLSAGDSREWLIVELTSIQLVFRAEANEEADDLIGDVLDFLTGWSAPQHRL